MWTVEILMRVIGVLIAPSLVMSAAGAVAAEPDLSRSAIVYCNERA
jgi:hypothetical protein